MTGKNAIRRRVAPKGTSVTFSTSSDSFMGLKGKTGGFSGAEDLLPSANPGRAAALTFNPQGGCGPHGCASSGTESFRKLRLRAGLSRS